MATNVKVSGGGGGCPGRFIFNGNQPKGHSCRARGWRLGPAVFVFRVNNIFLSLPSLTQLCVHQQLEEKRRKFLVSFVYYLWGFLFCGGELLVVVDGGVCLLCVCNIPFPLPPPPHGQSHWLSHSQSVFGCRSVRCRHILEREKQLENPFFFSSFTFHCQETRHVFFIQFPTLFFLSLPIAECTRLI